MAEAVVLASGSGSNFEAIADRISETDHQITALICDRPGAACLERAKRLRIDHHIIPYQNRRKSAEQELYSLLTSLQPDLVVLAGFMKVLPPNIVQEFSGRLINIHPSLLPDFPGLNAIERSFRAGDSTMGITIHYVDTGVDTGPIIEQHSVETEALHNLESAERQIHELEHRYYPEVVVRLLDQVEQRLSQEISS
jgi:phosphoribosylglycinamide formyltransferase-1